MCFNDIDEKDLRDVLVSINNIRAYVLARDPGLTGVVNETTIVLHRVTDVLERGIASRTVPCAFEWG